MSESCVYVQDKDHGWLPAHVLKQDGDSVQVRVFSVDETETLGERTVSLKDYPSQALPFQNVDASGKLMEMADMVDLPSLHEAAILYNLRTRHLDQKPYTRVGDLIVAVNPFKWMKKLYSEETRSQYVDKLIWNVNTAGGDARSGLPPHVYETSSMAYRGLAVEGQHQSILVSGESGAGKTETVKIVMSHLASVHSASEETDSHHLVVQRVLDSHPLLEAFGNAKTIRNDNSSRFGKFIQMQFDVEDATTAAFSGRAVPNCVLAGSKCETYLLEKSRVVGHETDERTYHIFYQLLASENKSDFWVGLKGKTNESFRYVGSTNTLHIEGRTDAERWDRTIKALNLLDVKDEKLRTLMRAVCVVMQLGNITFAEDPEDAEKSIITSNEELTALATLMDVPEDVLEKALTYRTVVAGKGESYPVPLKVDRACDGCDAFAKEIYQQAFDWLVRQINTVTCAEVNYEDASDVEEYGLVGLLDIFGFESFETNRFEQLCINYTNEKLQQRYTLDIFCSVQEEYTNEGIELGEITFADNIEVLRMIEGRVGIISVLNEECVRPNGSDTAFVSKIKSVNCETAHLVSEKLHKPTEFGIQHYAGQVTYDATNFVQKNTDSLPRDVVDCACMSSNTLIKVEVKAAADSKMSAENNTTNRHAGKRGGASHTVTAKFKSQLSHLMLDITKTKTRYIRCIKPNPEKAPLKMDMASSAEQLRCAGVVAAVTISRVAFPNRLMHETALERFSCLEHVDLDVIVDEKKDETDDDPTGFRVSVSTLITTLLKELEVEAEDGVVTKAFEVGKSRVYFRTGALEFLEAKRLVALGAFAITIELIVRGFTARSIFWKIKYAAIDSQANARRTIARTVFLRVKQACILIECWTRCVFAKRELKRLQHKAASIKLQSRWRSIRASLMLAKCKEAAITIQKTARGAIQRPKYREELKEAEEEARVNTKVAALQKRLQETEMKWIQADKKRIEAEKRAEGLGSPGVSRPESPATPSGAANKNDEKKEDDEKKEETQSPVNQQALIDESNEMLNYFRQEVFKLKSANYLFRTDLAELRELNQHLTDHAASLEASHSALKQNITKLSQSNMRMAQNNAEQKDQIHKLKHELKMEKIKQSSELKALQDEMKNNDRQHDTETTRLSRELERLRKIVATSPTTAKNIAKHERATLAKSGYRPGMDMPRVSSMGNMSTISAMSSEQEWCHDGFYEKSRFPQKRETTSWTVVSKKKRPRKPKPPPVKSSGLGDRGPRNRTPMGYAPPKKTVNSSLASAAKALTRSPSPCNSTPPSSAAAPASASRRSSFSGSASEMKPTSGTPKQTMSQSSLASAASSKSFQRVGSKGQINTK